MCVEKDKIEDIKKKIRDSIKGENMVMEDEPQSSGDISKVFDDDKEDRESTDEQKSH